MSTPLDLSRLCVHTITTKPWPIETAIEKYAAAGITGMTVWRDALDGRDPVEIRRRIDDAGLTVVSLCRGGFFPSADADVRKAAIADNKAAVDEAAAIGAPGIVLVCGADPRQTLDVSRRQIVDGIAEVAPYAADRGVSLYVEPLHPMYADTRSGIVTLGQAIDVCDEIAEPNVSIALDVYHVFWDPAVEAEIARCGESGYLSAFHVCDWRVPTRDFLNDRTVMGNGCIDVPGLRKRVEATGFKGHIEVEIFSTEYWATDMDDYLARIIDAYQKFT